MEVIAPKGDALSRSYLPLEAWLPVGWQGWNLDLEISATVPPRDASGGERASAGTGPAQGAVPFPGLVPPGGEAVPDLRLTKTGPAMPLEVSGRIELHDLTLEVGGQGQVRGTLYFPVGTGQPPDVAIVVTSPARFHEAASAVRYYGPATRLRKVSAGNDIGPKTLSVAGRMDALAARSFPSEDSMPALMEDGTPWVEWLSAPLPPLDGTEYELILR